MPTQEMLDVTGFLGLSLRAGPELGLLALACLTFLGGTFIRGRLLWGLVGVIGLGFAAGFSAIQSGPAFAPTRDFFCFDDVASCVRLIVPILGMLMLPILVAEVDDVRAADIVGCTLCACAGVSLTSMAGDLILLFLGLEAVSIPTYVMLYLARHDRRGQEATLKYFMLSIFSSALFLFGASYLYGLTGQTRLTAVSSNGLSRGILELLADPSSQRFDMPRTLAIALIFVIAGLGMKITAVPFHFYAPDVYQGTSPGMAGFLSWFPKAAGLIALVRVLGLAHGHGEPFGGMDGTLIWILAVVTMTLGNCLAIWQGNLRRMLAYSGVAQGGYMLASLAVGPATHQHAGGVGPMLFYLAAYGIMSLGAFAIIAYLNDPEMPVEHIDDLAGLGSRAPIASWSLAICLFGMLGLPLTVGFIAKAQVLLATLVSPMAAGSSLIGILGLLIVFNAAVGAWYYLGLVHRMFLRRPLGPQGKCGPKVQLAAGLVCAILTVLLGIVPSWLGQWTQIRQGGRVHAIVPAVTMVAKP